MRKLTILVDCDNVLEDLVAIWIDYLNKEHGTNIQPEDITEWDVTKFFPSLSRNQVYAPLHKKSLWEEIEPLPLAVEYLKKLIDDGHKVVILTSSHPDTVSMKINKFLLKRFPYLSFKDVIISSQKQLVKGDILIDDAPQNLEGGSYLGILFNAPHNRSYNAEGHGFIRARDWFDIYRIVSEYSSRDEKKRSDNMADYKKVILYTVGCPKCFDLGEMLVENGINFVENSNRDYMIEQGFKEVPMLEVDGKIMNFEEAKEWIQEIKA